MENSAPRRHMTLDELKRREQGEQLSTKPRFYAGGEKSGMYVEGGNDDGDNDNDEHVKKAVKDVFEKAKPAAAAANSLNEDKQPKPAFKGRSRKINSPHQSADQENEEKEREEEEGEMKHEQQIVSRNVIFWQDGLSIENGPLRPYNEPSTAKLLDQLNNGQAPWREFGIMPGQNIDVKVAHCLDKKFDKQEQDKELQQMHGANQEKQHHDHQAFTGACHKLSEDNVQDVKGKEWIKEKPGDQLRFDPNKPSTKLQLRLSNGTRYEMFVCLALHFIESWKL